MATIARESTVCQTCHSIHLSWTNKEPIATSSNYGMEARVGIEPTNKGFADLCLTTWLPRRGSEALVLSLLEPGAGDGTRTRDIDLGKVALYQLSYSRR